MMPSRALGWPMAQKSLACIFYYRRIKLSILREDLNGLAAPAEVVYEEDSRPSRWIRFGRQVPPNGIV